MIRFSRLIQLIKRRFSWFGSSRRPSESRYERRRLFLEPLQPREVLAVAIDAFTPTPSGFVADLSAEIRESQLNLYDTQSHAMGDADVTLTGAVTGNVKGSLVVEGTRLTFIATGGALPTDTYTVHMRSAADGIVDQALGELLDGEFNGSLPSGNGVPGGDFNFTFSVTAQPLVVSLPDFARGPSQSINVPAMGSGVALPTGLPVRLSDANGVTSLTVRINYNPALLTITGVELGADAPQGSQVQSNVTVPGEIMIAFFTLDPMSAGAVNIINLVATVPETATYGATQVVDITFLEVNVGDLQATADDALHVVAFVGDANGNRRYDAEDARLIARTGIGLDTGFVTPTPTTTATTRLLFPNVDAVIIGDVTGVDGLSPLDASDVLRRVVGLPTLNIPAISTAFAPTALNLSATTIAENQPIGTSVGTFSTTDPDAGDTHTYSLVAGTGDTNNSLFTISGVTLRTAAVFDHATQSTLNVRVRTTDSTGRSLETTFTISVTDVNAAPTGVAISNSTVAENTSVGTSVGTLTTTDPDSGNTHTYSLVSGTGATDNASFTIVGSELRVAAALDFETQASYSVRIRSTDQGGLFFEQVLTISVTNVNEAPTSLALSDNTVLEGEAVGTEVGTLSTIDQDTGDTHTYSLITGPGSDDNASFSISGDRLLTGDVFDHATKSSYSIRVRSTDDGALSVEQVITITITATNVAPTALALENSSVDENAAAGTLVGTFSTTDANATDTHTYTLVAGSGDTGNGSFTVSGNQLLTVDTFDFETQGSYSIRVRSTDSFGLFVDDELTITINDLNDAPTDLAISNDTIAEDASIGAMVGTLTTTDPDSGNTHTYSLVAGVGDTDNAGFTIVGDELRTAVTLDFETQTTYSARVQSMDQDGLTVEKMLTITVTNVNEAPT
ncbi:MAG: cadherin domain-containing protein, partial [Planctomycetota bacterium]